MVEPYAMVQTGAAIITALAAAGAFTYVRRGLRLLNVHDRVLFGEDNVEGSRGIVPTVRENSTRSKRNRYLIAEEHDLHDDDVLFRGGSDSD